MSANHAVLLITANGGGSTAFFWRGNQGLRLITVAHAFGTKPAWTDWSRWDRTGGLHLSAGVASVRLFGPTGSPLFSYFSMQPPGAMLDVISLHLDQNALTSIEARGLPSIAQGVSHGMPPGAPVVAYGFEGGKPIRREGAVLSHDNNMLFRSSAKTTPGQSGSPVFTSSGGFCGMMVGYDENGNSVIVSAQMISYLAQQPYPIDAPGS